MPDDIVTPQIKKRRALWRNIVFVSLLLVGVGLGWLIGESGQRNKDDTPGPALTEGEAEPSANARMPVPGRSEQMPENAPAAGQTEAVLPSGPLAEVPDKGAGADLLHDTRRDDTGRDKLRDMARAQPELDFTSPPPMQAAEPEAPARGWRQFAALTPANPRNMPQIVVIIDDIGPNLTQAREAVALPAAVTLAILPYADYAAELAREARINGHEILVHLPMEPDNDADPGPQAMLADLPEAEFISRLNWNLAQIEGYVGVNNHMGSRLTQDPVAMQRILSVLKQRDLLFLDSRTIAATIAGDLSRAMQLPTLERDVFIDNELAADKIRQQLRRAEEIAQAQGSAILIGHPHRETLDVLRDWFSSLEGRGFQLVPLTAVLKEKG